MFESEHTMPRHIAIIMDGNGRWAKKRLLPRTVGHYYGRNMANTIVDACVERKVEVLTLYAFSSENWQRPKIEVTALMKLLMNTLKSDVDRLHNQGIRIRLIGDKSRFQPDFQVVMEEAQRRTADNTGMVLNIALSYGGRWDLVQAVQVLAGKVKAGEMSVEDIDEDAISANTSIAGLPDPDLFIRTGGESRISNYLLWNLAYSEMYFTDALWPDFKPKVLDEALAWYAGRQRRFGLTGDQVEEEKS